MRKKRRHILNLTNISIGAVGVNITTMVISTMRQRNTCRRLTLIMSKKREMMMSLETLEVEEEETEGLVEVAETEVEGTEVEGTEVEEEEVEVIEIETMEIEMIMKIKETENKGSMRKKLSLRKPPLRKLQKKQENKHQSPNLQNQQSQQLGKRH